MPAKDNSRAGLAAENSRLRRQLQEAEAALQAIREGGVDALVLGGPAGAQVVPLPGTDSPYRVTIETLNEGVVTVLAGGAIGYCNRHFAQLVQQSMEALLGADLHRLLPASEQAALDGLLGQADPPQARGEFHLLRPDGSQMPALLSGRPQTMAGVEAVILVVTDLTERMQAEAERQFQAQLLAAVGQAVIATDLDGRIIHWNPAAERIYGWPAAEVLGHAVVEIIGSQATREQAEELLAYLTAGHDWSGEFDVRRRDGSIFPVYVTDSPITDAASRLTGIIGVSVDISARQQAEAALRASEKSYRDLFENSIVGLSQTLPNGRLLRANRTYARLFGYDNPEQIMAQVTDVGRELYARLEDRVEILRRLEAVGEIEPREVEFVRRDGAHFWVLLAVQIVRDAAGNALYYQATHLDITQRRQADLALRASERDYRDLFENSAVGICHVQPGGNRFMRVNQAFARMYGYDSPEQMLAEVTDIGRQIYAHPADRPAFRSKLDSQHRLLPDELEVIRRDGTHFYVLVAIQQVRDSQGQVRFFQGTHSDITARKQAELALRESEKSYRELFENSIVGIAQSWPDGRLLRVNQTYARLFGYDSPADLAAHISDVGRDLYLHPEERREIMSILAAGGQIEPREIQMIRRDGTRFWMLVEAQAVSDTAGAVLYYQATYSDITQRKQADLAMRESEKSYRELFENSLVGVAQVHPDGQHLLRVNPAYARMYGYDSPADMLAAVADFGQLYARPEDQALMRQRLNSIEVSRPREVLVLRRDGSPMYVLATLQRVRDDDGTLRYYETTQSDITGRKQAELEVRQRLAELAVVQRISAALRNGHTAEEMMPRLLDETLAVLGAEAGAIWLLDAAGAQVRLSAARGWYAAPERATLSRLDEGITAHVMQTRRPYISREFVADPVTRPGARPLTPPGWGGIVAPIQSEQAVVGILHLSVPLPREVQPLEAHLLTTLTEIAGSAIERSTLHEQTSRRLQQLTALSEIDRVIVSTFDVQVVLSVLIDKAMTELGVDAADILLMDKDAGWLRYSAGKGFRGVELQSTDLQPGTCYAGQAALERRLVRVPDLRQTNASPRLIKAQAREGFISYYGVPLLAKGQVKGVLEVFQRRVFEPDGEWVSFLDALASQAAIAIDNAALFSELQRSNLGLTLAYDATIEGWSRALDLRDKETEGHSLRVTDKTLRLARLVGIIESDLAQVRWGALLHDMGKMGVPDRILLKPGPLTDDEWAVMRQHPSLAYQMLAPIQHLRGALDIPYCHHEKWDGSGYPRGLKGEAIPLAARLFAVVDVWDALTSDRPYRPAWPAQQVREYLQAQAGSHFDLRLVELALNAGVLDGRPY